MQEGVSVNESCEMSQSGPVMREWMGKL